MYLFAWWLIFLSLFKLVDFYPPKCLLSNALPFKILKTNLQREIKKMEWVSGITLHGYYLQRPFAIHFLEFVRFWSCSNSVAKKSNGRLLLILVGLFISAHRNQVGLCLLRRYVLSVRSGNHLWAYMLLMQVYLIVSTPAWETELCFYK